ncbi:pyruvate kinase [Capnocytophaga cynodegmi]|uniref:Pyruvate kinase n=1 Tax=Capnocytophaga cynodegmi TaxID=28189 RepID=A0A0B7H485_9FLAO|nr:pyruvate kinase [Capnocytophaga cynodegmi]ATA68112.1 pyruvate kinase [Capnocytophaga cynodegmi]CEN34228.1 Pyruvate kinase [Capnocytophaga cynodegmi]CEN34451.1 Pyruvate kinase [Capnocytophaga cynodegmi]CEN41834.1 Pyruvate kinase [Capnocytophaga cynodegmi]GIM54607.1 pyruvate kinase [Capnocytophaga cynodegmi]
MLSTKKTKIVATLGPATDTRDVIKDMMQAGVNVFRINFSHADYEDVKKRVDMIRSVNKEYGYNTAILADLQGPKLRVGVMEEGIIVNPGDKITFATGEPFTGNQERVYMNYKEFPKDVNPGERILLDDGKLIFKVVSTNKENEVEAEVIQGGPLKSKKGVNLPNTNVSLPALTEKDIKDALFAISQEVDWFALSFVRNPADIQDLKDLINENSSNRIPIIAKIEKPEALVNIDKIMANCDGIMVARGDLGVEIPAEEVPLIQKELVHKAKLYHIPVIIATQMMESMISSLTPTRAEVNDVGNSVMDGADAVMLSGETSVGAYPVQVIEQMSRIIKSVEESELIKVPMRTPFVRSGRYVTNSICYHAATMANEMNAKVISTLTNSGYTAYRISSYRPNSHILVFTSSRRILTQLSLLWGVTTFYYDRFVSTDETIEDVNHIANEKGYVNMGDIMISLAAMPIQGKGKVNTLRVSEIDSCAIRAK